LTQHYFFVASLPMLHYDAAPPISYESFLGMCAEHLSPRLNELVRAARLLPAPEGRVGHPLLRRWYRWETALRNELVRLRAAAAGLDPADYRRALPRPDYENGGGDVVACELLAREAFGQENPLSAEGALDRARWQLLSSQELLHGFDEHRILVYSLKLQILGRKAKRIEEAGLARLDRIRETAIEEIKAGEGLYE
jgi:hypothetical protein